jgi:tRNA nucleotidyltransferase (CCA-adding enzyme)
VRLWLDVGAAAVWLPGLDAARWSAGADRPPRDAVLLTALLLPDAAAALRRLRASNAEIARAEAIARGPAEPAAASPEAVRRWRALTQLAADDLITLWRMRHDVEPAWAAAVAASRAAGDPVSRAQLALDGNDLTALGVPPGRRIGEVLDLLLDRVLTDPSLNTRDRLTALARSAR